MMASRHGLVQDWGQERLEAVLQDSWKTDTGAGKQAFSARMGSLGCSATSGGARSVLTGRSWPPLRKNPLELNDHNVAPAVLVLRFVISKPAGKASAVHTVPFKDEEECHRSK